MTLRPPAMLRWDSRLSEKDRELVAELNASSVRLDGLRAIEINPTGPFGRSKIAWKLVTYQHVLLHRIVSLMDGVAVAWNAHSPLAALLSARAFMETFAGHGLFLNSGSADCWPPKIWAGWMPWRKMGFLPVAIRSSSATCRKPKRRTR